MPPDFLTRDEILTIHKDQLARYGGSDGIRDEGLLNSALALPQATFSGQFLHNDLCAMAAAYLFHIIRNHPFVDGNKRVGTTAAIVFLDMNGFEFEAVDEDLERIVLGVASSDIEKSALVQSFREHARQR